MKTLSDPTLALALAVPALIFLALWAALYFSFSGLELGLKAAVERASTRALRSRLARWSAAHPGWSGLRSHASIILVLVAGGVIALAAGEAFVEIAERFRRPTSPVFYADHAVNAWFQSQRHPAFTTILDAATVVGGPPGMALLVAVAAGIQLLRKRWAPAVFLIVTGAGGALLNLGLKTVFERVRPPAASAIAVAPGYSFPSGHAMGSLIVLGSIAYLVLREPMPWKPKSACLALLMTAVLLIGLSRVYLGVHWISDIAGGWSAGAVWLATTVVALETFLRVRQLRRGVPPTVSSTPSAVAGADGRGRSRE